MRSAVSTSFDGQQELQSYVENGASERALVINVESVAGIANLDALLDPALGVDSVLIGPHDLSCSLGVPEQYAHPKFTDAVKTIFRKARKHGVRVYPTFSCSQLGSARHIHPHIHHHASALSFSRIQSSIECETREIATSLTWKRRWAQRSIISESCSVMGCKMPMPLRWFETGGTTTSSQVETLCFLSRVFRTVFAKSKLL